MKDNPTVADPENVLQEVLRDKGWTENDPEYVREYLGQNCYDSTRTVLPNRKYYDKLPENVVWERCVIGVDYGFSDFNSFVPVLVANDGKRYVANVYKANHLAASDLVKKAMELKEWAEGLKIPNIMFVADTSDQSISQDMWRNGVKIQNCYKSDERLQWSKLKERLATGDLLVEKDGVIDDECGKTVWKYDDEKKQVIYEIDDDVYHPESLDALKYANFYLDTKKASKTNFS